MVRLNTWYVYKETSLSSAHGLFVHGRKKLESALTSILNCMAAVSRSYILVMTVYCTTTISLIMILWLPQVAQYDNIHILLLHTHLCHANFTETFCGVPTLLGSVCEHLSATVCGKQEWCYITTIYLLWYAIDECLQLDFDFDWKMPINAQSTNKLQSSSSCECF